jgi:hypothetical protein
LAAAAAPNDTTAQQNHLMQYMHKISRDNNDTNHTCTNTSKAGTTLQKETAHCCTPTAALLAQDTCCTALLLLLSTTLARATASMHITLL